MIDPLVAWLSPETLSVRDLMVATMIAEGRILEYIGRTEEDNGADVLMLVPAHYRLKCEIQNRGLDQMYGHA